METDSAYIAPLITAEKEAELRFLPIGIREYFRDSKRFTITNANLHHSRGHAIEGVHFPKETFRDIGVYILKKGIPITEGLRARIMCMSLHHFYNDEIMEEFNPDFEEQFTGMLSMLFTYVGYEGVVKTGIGAALKAYRYNLKICELTVEQLEALSEPYVKKFIELFSAPSFSDIITLMPIIGLSAFVLIGKNINDANRAGWFRNRWRAMGGICGVVFPFEAFPAPELRACTGLYLFMTSRQGVRIAVFKAYRALAANKSDGFSVYFDRIVGLLQWTEMNHIWTINHYLFTQNREILAFPELSGEEVTPMKAAIMCLLKYPEHERPYLKLLYEQEDLRPLLGYNFPFFSAAARAISVMNNSSMRNLLIDKSSDMADFQARVTAAVEKKRSVGGLAASCAYAAGRPVEVRKLAVSVADEAVKDLEALGVKPLTL